MAGKSGRNPAGRSPAPGATKQVAQAPEKPDSDVFAGLTVTAETEPLPKASRDTGPNPFAEAVLASYGTVGEDGKLTEDKTAAAYGAVVKETDVKRAVYLIRKAARENGLGVRIIEDAPENGNVKIRFKAKAKKRRKETATTATV